MTTQTSIIYAAAQPEEKNKQLNKNKKLYTKNKYTGNIYILTTKNNAVLTLTDLKGNTKYWTSCGCVGFKNSRKSTTYAAQIAAENLSSKALSLGFFNVNIKLKGLGFGKESTVRAIYKSGLIISNIQETTPLSHNGCRPSKKRRI